MEKNPSSWKKRGVFALVSRRAGTDELGFQEEEEDDPGYADEEERRRD